MNKKYKTTVKENTVLILGDKRGEGQTATETWTRMRELLLGKTE